MALAVLAACCCLFFVRPKKPPPKIVKPEEVKLDPDLRPKPILGTTDGRVQLLAAPEYDGAPGAPLWSALVIDGVTVPYEEVKEVQMDESALQFIVEQTPRTPLVQADPLRVRVYSRPEFHLWREALYPKILPTQSGEEEKEQEQEEEKEEEEEGEEEEDFPSAPPMPRSSNTSSLTIEQRTNQLETAAGVDVDGDGDIGEDGHLNRNLEA